MIKKLKINVIIEQAIKEKNVPTMVNNIFAISYRDSDMPEHMNRLIRAW